VPGKSKSLCFLAKMSMEQPEYGSDQQTWRRNTVTKYGLAVLKIGMEQPTMDLTNKHGQGTTKYGLAPSKVGSEQPNINQQR
jgi:hypothetical protein